MSTKENTIEIQKKINKLEKNMNSVEKLMLVESNLDVKKELKRKYDIAKKKYNNALKIHDTEKWMRENGLEYYKEPKLQKPLIIYSHTKSDPWTGPNKLYDRKLLFADPRNIRGSQKSVKSEFLDGVDKDLLGLHGFGAGLAVAGLVFPPALPAVTAAYIFGSQASDEYNKSDFYGSKSSYKKKGKKETRNNLHKLKKAKSQKEKDKIIYDTLEKINTLPPKKRKKYLKTIYANGSDHTYKADERYELLRKIYNNFLDKHKIVFLNGEFNDKQYEVFLTQGKMFITKEWSELDISASTSASDIEKKTAENILASAEFSMEFIPHKFDLNTLSEIDDANDTKDIIERKLHGNWRSIYSDFGATSNDNSREPIVNWTKGNTTVNELLRKEAFYIDPKLIKDDKILNFENMNYIEKPNMWEDLMEIFYVTFGMSLNEMLWFPFQTYGYVQSVSSLLPYFYLLCGCDKKMTAVLYITFFYRTKGFFKNMDIESPFSNFISMKIFNKEILTKINKNLRIILKNNFEKPYKRFHRDCIDIVFEYFKNGKESMDQGDMSFMVFISSNAKNYTTCFFCSSNLNLKLALFDLIYFTDFDLTQNYDTLIVTLIMISEIYLLIKHFNTDENVNKEKIQKYFTDNHQPGVMSGTNAYKLDSQGYSILIEYILSLKVVKDKFPIFHDYDYLSFDYPETIITLGKIKTILKTNDSYKDFYDTEIRQLLGSGEKSGDNPKNFIFKLFSGLKSKGEQKYSDTAELVSNNSIFNYLIETYPPFLLYFSEFFIDRDPTIQYPWIKFTSCFPESYIEPGDFMFAFEHGVAEKELDRILHNGIITGGKQPSFNVDGFTQLPPETETFEQWEITLSDKSRTIKTNNENLIGKKYKSDYHIFSGAMPLLFRNTAFMGSTFNIANARTITGFDRTLNINNVEYSSNIGFKFDLFGESLLDIGFWEVPAADVADEVKIGGRKKKKTRRKRRRKFNDPRIKNSKMTKRKRLSIHKRNRTSKKY